MERASTDLPQPDLADDASVSPLPSGQVDAVEHMDGAVERVEVERVVPDLEQSAHRLTAPGIEDVAQPVAEQVEAEHGEEDAAPGKNEYHHQSGM